MNTFTQKQQQSSPSAATPLQIQSASAGSAANCPSHESIALLAYDIYARNGKVPGHCKHNWHRAERELFEAAQRELFEAAQHESAQRRMAQRDFDESPQRPAKNFDDVMPSNTGPGHSIPVSPMPRPPYRAPGKP